MVVSSSQTNSSPVCLFPLCEKNIASSFSVCLSILLSVDCWEIVMLSFWRLNDFIVFEEFLQKIWGDKCIVIKELLRITRHKPFISLFQILNDPWHELLYSDGTSQHYAILGNKASSIQSLVLLDMPPYSSSFFV